MEQTAVKRNKASLVVGIIITIFAIIGLITVIGSVVSSVSSYFENREYEKREEYKTFIAPVIMNDPDPFDDVINADQSQLIGAAIWAFLSGEIDPNSVDYTENGMVVKQEVVEKEFSRLFGKDVAPLHQTVEGGDGIEFEYDSEKKTYTVPITGINAIYSPTVLDMKTHGSTVILTVGYLASTDWQQGINGDMIPPEPVKKISIYLRKGNDDYYISSIKEISSLETATGGVTVDSEEESETKKETKAHTEKETKKDKKKPEKKD